MNKVIALCILFFGSLGIASAQDPGWPRQITKPQGTVVHYEPRSTVGTSRNSIGVWPFRLLRRAARRP